MGASLSSVYAGELGSGTGDGSQKEQGAIAGPDSVQLARATLERKLLIRRQKGRSNEEMEGFTVVTSYRSCISFNKFAKLASNKLRRKPVAQFSKTCSPTFLPESGAWCARDESMT